MLKFFLSGLLLAVASAAAAAPVRVPNAMADLVSSAAVARPGEVVTVGLHLVHDPGWHTYWKNPGDSGMATRIAWRLPDGVTAGPIQWPVPERIDVGPLTNYGYEGDLLLLTDVSVPASWPAGKPLPLRAQADWLICKEVCLPGGATLELTVPTAAGASRPDPVWGPKIEAERARIPHALTGWRVSASVTPRNIVLDLRPGQAGARPLTRAAFFPETPDVIDNPSAQTLERTDQGYRLLLMAAPTFGGDVRAIEGLLVAEPGLDDEGLVRAAEVSVPYPGGVPDVKAAAPEAGMTADEIRGATVSGKDLGLAAAVAFAFVGGLILNLMPCVFPVVSIKVLGFVEHAHGDRRDLRRHGLSFAAGIVVCFWLVAAFLLGLRASGEALGWGYQLQSPPIIATLAVLFFLLALNLSGVFEIGTRLQTLAGTVRERDGLGGAFLSGMLATAIATPCTAPFMGAALGFALTQPAATSMAVFTALALGMGAPYVLLSIFPALTRWLPRPGRWMESLKQFLAFPLYLTVVWLVWVYGEQLGTSASARLLAALVLLAAAAWAWRRFGDRTPWRGGLVAAVFVASAVLFGWPPAEPPALPGRQAEGSWTPYSEAALATARAAGPVFVDFTAAWCVTCQVNKRVVLDTEPVVRAFESHGVTRLLADWTNRDDEIGRALARLGRSGVPVYVFYPAGGGAPELLPELLTRDIVMAAIDRATASPGDNPSGGNR
ncbi:MAG: thiol:disulfide interchange protein [Betaproteobacteria bacterium]|nr:thiol:disulfide interchange protein [Betaproteobacteria bacterium]